MKIKFGKLEKEEETAIKTMIMDVVDNFDIIKGCAHNIRVLEKKLGTSESTHNIVHMYYASESRYNYPGVVRSYMYNEFEASLKKKLSKDSNFEVYHDISKLPIINRKSTSKDKLASICNEYTRIGTMTVEYNKGVLSDILKTLIRKCDSSLAIMMLEDNINSIIYILMQFIDDVSLIRKGYLPATVLNATVDKKISKEIAYLLIDMFTAYQLFDNKLQEKLLEGLTKYTELDFIVYGLI